MLSYIRPGLLGTCETEFRKKYVDAIYAGLAKDAGNGLRAYSDELIQGENEMQKIVIRRTFGSLTMYNLTNTRRIHSKS
jgi:hypothetical protein